MRGLLPQVGQGFEQQSLSSSVAVVIPQHPTKPLALLQFSSRLPNVFIRFEQPVAQTLVIPFGVVVLQVVAFGIPE